MLKKIKQWFGGAKRPQRLAMLCMALVMAMSVGITAAWAAGGGIATATSTSTSDSPVFVNDSVPGSLTIKKNVDWSEYDEDTDFEFKVVLNAPDGEAIEGNWSYKSDEKPEMVAFAVYSEDDNSLDFYKRAKTSVPKVGATFNGKTVTRLYKNIENQTGTSYYSVPWFSESFTTGWSGISSVCVVDAGIQPTN